MSPFPKNLSKEYKIIEENKQYKKELYKIRIYSEKRFDNIILYSSAILFFYSILYFTLFTTKNNNLEKYLLLFSCFLDIISFFTLLITQKISSCVIDYELEGTANKSNKYNKILKFLNLIAFLALLAGVLLFYFLIF